MSNKKMIIFDFDGTLVDSQKHFDIALADFSTARSLPYDPAKMTVGYVDPLRNDLGWGVTLEEQPEIFKEFGFYMDDQVLIHKKFIPDLYEHVIDVLEELKTEFDLSIITARSRSTMLATLEYHNLQDIFPMYRTHCCAKERNYLIKPSPDALHCLLRDTKHDVNDIVMVGDTTSDILMANAAKAKSIGVLWGVHPVEKLQGANPTLIIDQMLDLPNAVKQIFSL